jgi:hypothetical protein
MKLASDYSPAAGYTTTITQTDGGNSCTTPLTFVGVNEAFCLLRLTITNSEYVPKIYILKVIKNGVTVLQKSFIRTYK